MTTKTRADEMHDALVELYGPGDLDYLLSLFYVDFPTSKRFETSSWLNFITNAGAVGRSHGDKDYDFWVNRKVYGGFSSSPGSDFGGALGLVSKDAEAVWRAVDYRPGLTGQWLKDKTGHGHHMRLGSVGRATVLDGALVINGVSGQYAGSPDHADLDITSDIDIRALVALDDWTPAADSGLVGKRSAAATINYYLYITSAGLVGYAYSPDNVAVRATNSTVAAATTAGVIDGGKLWVRATRVNATGVTTFYYASATITNPSGGDWIQLGSPVTTFAGEAPATNSALLELGSYASGTGNLLSGRHYRAIVKNGIGGTTVFDADFSAQPDGVPWFLESTGKRVTVFPARSVVSQGALFLPGVSGQYAVAADGPELDITGDIDIRTKVAADDWTPSANLAMVGKWATSNESFGFYTLSTGRLALEFRLSGGGAGILPTSTVSPTVSDGGILWVRVTRTASTGVTRFYTSTDGITWTQLGADVASTAGNLFIGTSSLFVGTATGAGGMFAGKIFRTIIKNGIDGTTVFDADFSNWNDGDGVAVPKQIVTGQYVKVLTDTTGADTNDPTFLPYSGEKYVYLPGIAGNYTSVPDSAALDITGDITLDCEVACDDWTPGATSTFIAKDGAYVLRLTTTGIPELVWVDSIGVKTATATISIPILDLQKLCVRVTLDVNDGAGNRVIKFFTSIDSITWVQLGATVTTAGITDIITNAASVIVGSTTGSAAFMVGKFYKARIYNAYTSDGTNPADVNKVLDINFADATEPYATFLARTGQTVTINRAATGKKLALVDRPMFLFGTDDYMECADHAALDFGTGEFTIAAAYRHFAMVDSQIINKKAGVVDNSAGYILRHNNPAVVGMYTGDGVMQVNAQSVEAPNGLMGVSWGKRMSTTLQSGTHTSAGTAQSEGALASITNALVLRIGRNNASSENAAMEWVGAGLWPDDLSATNITALDAEFGTNR